MLISTPLINKVWKCFGPVKTDIIQGIWLDDVRKIRSKKRWRKGTKK